MNNLCPVCGYDLGEPMGDGLICRCCGTQFGYQDSSRSHAELRAEWLAAGARRHSRRVPPPFGWSALKQWEEAGLVPEEEFVSA